MNELSHHHTSLLHFPPEYHPVTDFSSPLAKNGSWHKIGLFPPNLSPYHEHPWGVAPFKSDWVLRIFPAVRETWDKIIDARN